MVSTSLLAAMLVIAGALTYVAVSVLINRAVIWELFDLIRARRS
jgi:hypothetical protein